MTDVSLTKTGQTRLQFLDAQLVISYMEVEEKHYYKAVTSFLNLIFEVLLRIRGVLSLGYCGGYPILGKLLTDILSPVN